MRTYILSISDIKSQQRCKFRCQAETLHQAIIKAEANNPGFFMALRKGGLRNATVHS